MQDEIGSLEAGKKADLAVLRFDNFFATPLHNPVSALVYSALGNEPELVMIDGQAVMRDRTMQTVAESQVMQMAQEAANEVSERAGTARFKKRPWRSVAI